MVSAVFRGGCGSRTGGRSGAEVRDGRRRLGGEVFINRSPRRAAGKGRRACPLPHTPGAGPWGDPRLLYRLPRAAGSADRRRGREPNLCPLEERCLAVPSPSVQTRDPPWQGSRPAARPELQGARLGVAGPLHPRPLVRDSLWAGSGKPTRRTLSFRRRNAVSVPPPDSAPGIQLLVTFFKQINKQFLPCDHL